MYDSFSSGKMYYGRTAAVIFGSVVFATLLTIVL